MGRIEDFDSITNALGVNPTHSHRAGDKKGPSSTAYREDLWSYAPPVHESEPLDAHIQALWQVLRPHRERLLTLKKTLKVDVFCGYRTNHWGAGFEVQPGSLTLFQELDIPFGVSVIVS